jgi:peptide/nickel transport system ATP-binding protein
MTLPLLRRLPGLASAAVLGLLFLAAVVPGLLVPIARGALDHPYMAPGPGHLLGTDGIGQDLFTELVRAARISLGAALLASLVATSIGVFVGLAAGYLRGRWDEWLMRMTDVFLLLPGLPLIILLAAYLNSGLAGIALVIGLTAWPGTARVVRANVQQVRQHNFIRSAEAMGAGSISIMLRHILPNISPLVLAKGTLAAASAMVAEAGVSFLGLGDPHYRSWGSMLHDAFTNGGLLNGCYWWYLPPIVCISSMVLSLTLVGQRLLDPVDGRPALGKPVPLPSGSDDPENPLEEILRVRGLSVDFLNPDRTLTRAIDHLDLAVSRGQRVAIIGQTGSGKSVLLLALLGLLPSNAAISGRIRLNDADLTSLSESTLRKMRGLEISYVPQGAGNALNPLLTVGYQVAEQARAHQKISRAAAMERAVLMLRKTGIPEAERRSRDYPHRYSGGMIQRALVAMGLASGASLILLDEPTKGLDPMNRDALLHILTEMEDKTLVAVTHDLKFAERFAHQVVVMLDSRIVEVSASEDFFNEPLHPYAMALLKAQPRHGLQVLSSSKAGPSQVSGCPFAGRCSKASSMCHDVPPLVDRGGRWVRCWRYAPEST